MSGWDATIKCFALLGYLIGGYQAVTLAWSVEGWPRP